MHYHLRLWDLRSPAISLVSKSSCWSGFQQIPLDTSVFLLPLCLSLPWNISPKALPLPGSLILLQTVSVWLILALPLHRVLHSMFMTPSASAEAYHWNLRPIGLGPQSPSLANSSQSLPKLQVPGSSKQSHRYCHYILRLGLLSSSRDPDLHWPEEKNVGSSDIAAAMSELWSLAPFPLGNIQRR